MRSQIEPMKKVAGMLRRYRPLLLNWFRAKGLLSSGVVDAFNTKPGLFMTQPAAMLPDPETTKFNSVAHPHRTGEYVSGALCHEPPHLHDLETSRDGRVMNNSG